MVLLRSYLVRIERLVKHVSELLEREFRSQVLELEQRTCLAEEYLLVKLGALHASCRELRLPFSPLELLICDVDAKICL